MLLIHVAFWVEERTPAILPPPLVLRSVLKSVLLPSNLNTIFSTALWVEERTSAVYLLLRSFFHFFAFCCEERTAAIVVLSKKRLFLWWFHLKNKVLRGCRGGVGRADCIDTKRKRRGASWPLQARRYSAAVHDKQQGCPFIQRPKREKQG